ncbi:MAG TPA: hypothetical protein DEB30_01760 [Candidatus Peribacter riflensis]|uniref:Uncharacterized protein n=1 Tax=Candidatus Peribacter riflensis TaxID=1735162 RepID=A0A0S1SQ39_9BACT|nr:MAG: hypothetical protein PeribacterA2_1027 [Candidatus Peribacter riflensis]OGJ76581.1 MAG: hypothetical protein A2398_04195 [Candidatus Peribacteria bacterium RIFOXYB1_FULL_57_12]OGJ82842.1 MAG: hypothetical protein A2412_01680 [Candidatus Peribacteria bacterium RIFOXYC1_FULL_58_8]ALM11488.1 MAG: hypothetical protein PeribacterB2_1029 [Candidatus Peribacter riflensis]ALM12590.1 MAG: hypothetical protein PeribacterC2_1028 [Candidatus Peribacter riflensis]
METNNTRRPSLWKQLLGAVGGAAIALLLYQAYKVSAPIVTAWLVVPQSQIDAEHPGATRVNAEVSDYEFDRLTAKAREIYERFAAEQGPQANVLPGGIEVTQPTPISSSSIARVDLEDLVASSSSAAFSAMAVETASSSVMAQAEQVVLATESASSARVRADTQLQAKLAGESLPSSGIGTTLAAALALGAAATFHRKQKAR